MAVKPGSKRTSKLTRKRCCRIGGADGPCGQRQVAELFAGRQVGELHLEHERRATGLGSAVGGRISPNDHQRR